MAESSKRRPAFEAKAGLVRATVWPNETDVPPEFIGTWKPMAHRAGDCPRSLNGAQASFSARGPVPVSPARVHGGWSGR